MEEICGNLFGARKVYNQVVAEIQYDGFQAHDYSHDHQSQEVKKLQLKSRRSYPLSKVGGFSDVFGKH